MCFTTYRHDISPVVKNIGICRDERSSRHIPPSRHIKVQNVLHDISNVRHDISSRHIKCASRLFFTTVLHDTMCFTTYQISIDTITTYPLFFTTYQNRVVRRPPVICRDEQSICRDEHMSWRTCRDDMSWRHWGYVVTVRGYVVTIIFWICPDVYVVKHICRDMSWRTCRDEHMSWRTCREEHRLWYVVTYMSWRASFRYVVTNMSWRTCRD